MCDGSNTLKKVMVDHYAELSGQPVRAENIFGFVVSPEKRLIDSDPQYQWFNVFEERAHLRTVDYDFSKLNVLGEMTDATPSRLVDKLPPHKPREDQGLQRTGGNNSPAAFVTPAQDGTQFSGKRDRDAEAGRILRQALADLLKLISSKAQGADSLIWDGPVWTSRLLAELLLGAETVTPQPASPNWKLDPDSYLRWQYGTNDWSAVIAAEEQRVMNFERLLKESDPAAKKRMPELQHYSAFLLSKVKKVIDAAHTVVKLDLEDAKCAKLFEDEALN